MGRVSDCLIDIATEVLQHCSLPDDDANFDAVQEWIIENVNLDDLPSTVTIAESFRANNICPQCQTIIKDHHHSCFAMERT